MTILPRYIILLSGILLLHGCVESDTFRVTIENNYAESIFSVDISTDEKASWQPVITAARVAGGGTIDKEAKPGTKAFYVRISATSLGETNTWILGPGKITGPGPFLDLTYDYDLATAEFALSRSVSDIDMK